MLYSFLFGVFLLILLFILMSISEKYDPRYKANDLQQEKNKAFEDINS